MSSQRRKEGYLLIENRHAPGPTDAMLAEIRKTGHEFVNPQTAIFESATITCSHCQQVLIRNPLRTRPREYCAKCDHYICDACSYLAATQSHQPHVSMIQRIDAAQNAAVLALGKG